MPEQPTPPSAAAIAGIRAWARENTEEAQAATLTLLAALDWVSTEVAALVSICNVPGCEYKSCARAKALRLYIEGREP